MQQQKPGFAGLLFWKIRARSGTPSPTRRFCDNRDWQKHAERAPKLREHQAGTTLFELVDPGFDGFSACDRGC
jgi:hypothetical protein